MTRSICTWTATAVALAASLAFAAEKKGASKATKEAVKELNLAVQLLRSGKREQAIPRLRALSEAWPDDPVGVRAAATLKDHGVGKEVEVLLDDRKIFRDNFKIPDARILELAEKALEELRPTFKSVPPFFTRHTLAIRLYDSEARYLKQGGTKNSGGHFVASKRDFKKRLLEGEIEWFVPKYAATLKDRELRMKGTMYHEAAHYLSTVHFAGLLPSPIEEGIASFLESRFNKDYYQYFRQTERQRIESNARNGLNAVAKLADFTSMLESSRGFGKGDAMIGRWYGICYALVDFFEEAELGGRKSSFADLLQRLQAISEAQIKALESQDRVERLNARSVLETLVQGAYSVGLDAFHRALVQRIQTKYKQM